MKLGKYIIFSDNSGIIFPLIQSHSNMAMSVPHKPISAGFVIEKDGGYYCYGESITLRLKSRDCDSDFFMRKKIRETGTHPNLKRKGMEKGAKRSLPVP